MLWFAGASVISSAHANAHICVDNPEFTFGNRPVGSVSSAESTVTNCGDAALTFSGVEIDPATNAEFQVTTPCTIGLALVPGASCAVTVSFTPTAPGQVSGGVRLLGGSSSSDVIVFYGRGVDAQAGTAALAFVPPSAAYAPQYLGTQSAPRTIELRNVGAATMTLTALVINGPAAYDFLSGPGSTCFVGATLAAGAACQLVVYFNPQAEGMRLANLNVDSPQLATLAILQFSGMSTTAATTVDVIEFYNAAMDHYFISSLSADIDALDTGRFPGWVRTGQHFTAYPPSTLGASAVCRFYIPPALGDSHFYSASPAECAKVASAYPAFIEESADMMDVDLPDPITGACSVTDMPVYRVWDDRADTNHRYTTDPAIRALMVAQGWIAEGYGPDQVIMCAPKTM